MPYAVTRFQETPNPNALKCVLDRAIADRPRSYRSTPADPPSGDHVAAALFGIPGVASLLINQDWITVNKSPEADWSTLKPAIRKALASLPGES